jgi:hypothetical protein
MRQIIEPLNVDFYVDPRPMTKEDEKAINDYIKADKLKRSKKSKKLKIASDRIMLPKVGQKNRAST